MRSRVVILALSEIRLERIHGVERHNRYRVEADEGLLSPGPDGTLREALFTKATIAHPDGHSVECDQLTYRLPSKGAGGGRER